MSLIINDDCTSCDACVSVCPNQAIAAGDVIHVIDAARCTECVGAEDSPQCQLVCPADCIVAGAVESHDQLMAKYKGLHA
ncbi:MAG: YfhL family 4Fe-4S dicluster ferredoxin [Rhodospirillaceae bacterium]|nr:YfhL family 4Fe-4S dicluster ferredoxin [Rhodospirillales bacterium]